MASGEDWLMQPVLEGLIPYTALVDGQVDLVGIARMNDALNVRNENQRRALKAAEAKRK